MRTQRIKLRLCEFRCGDCHIAFKAAELIGDSRNGEFLLRSRGSAGLAYLNAITGFGSETFNEVSEILNKSWRLRLKHLGGFDRTDLLHEIVGFVFDEDPDGCSYHLNGSAECPDCGSHGTRFLKEVDPPEMVEVDVPVLASTKWQALTKRQKANRVHELVSHLV